MFRLILTCLACLTIAAPGLAQTRADPEAATGWAPKPLGTAARHMIVAAHPLAAEAGREILRAGGSAADAAVASLLVLNVVEPQSSGIGGGAFALVHGPDGLASYDARETAPMAATERLFFEGTRKLGWREAVPTGRSVGVPGLVRLMEVLHARHGRLAWAELFQPALSLARDGFAVSPRLAASVAAFEPVLAGTDAAAFLLPGGVALAEGEILRQPELAETLQTLATEGAEAFYKGGIAAEILAAIARPPLPGA
ncbi:MAG: gamma-glutamyltransferase, partial [Pseudomonadota bacterium]